MRAGEAERGGAQERQGHGIRRSDGDRGRATEHGKGLPAPWRQRAAEGFAMAPGRMKHNMKTQSFRSQIHRTSGRTGAPDH